MYKQELKHETRIKQFGTHFCKICYRPTDVLSLYPKVRRWINLLYLFCPPDFVDCHKTWYIRDHNWRLNMFKVIPKVFITGLTKNLTCFKSFQGYRGIYHWIGINLVHVITNDGQTCSRSFQGHRRRATAPLVLLLFHSHPFNKAPLFTTF